MLPVEWLDAAEQVIGGRWHPDAVPGRRGRDRSAKPGRSSTYVGPPRCCPVLPSSLPLEYQSRRLSTTLRHAGIWRSARREAEGVKAFVID